MPDAEDSVRLARSRRVPGGFASARPRRLPALVRVPELVREALGGDPDRGLLGPRGPLATAVVTTVYVVAAIGLARWDIAVSFAIVPLVLAALSMRARPGMVVAGITIGTVVAAEILAAEIAAAPGLEVHEVVELAAFGLVGLALRLFVVRLSRGRGELERASAELAAAEARVGEAKEATERWVGQLEVAQRAAARMAGRPSVRTVAEAVADEIRAIVDYHACRVYILEEPDDLVPVLSAGDDVYERLGIGDLHLKRGKGFAGWVAANGRPLLVPDANADPRGLTIPGTQEVDESMVVVPMRYEERVTGVIAVSKLGLHKFDLGDVRILSILADQAATAVESAIAMSASAALAEDLRRAADMSSALSRSLDTRQVADLIALHVGHALGADECVVSFWDRPGDQLLTWAHWPPRQREDPEPTFALADYPEKRRVLEAQPTSTISSADPGAGAHPAEVALLERDGQRGLVMIPLVAKGETIGLLELCSVGPLSLDARRIDLARAMANEAAMALSNAGLYEAARALANRDPLTGFFNHRYLHERLGEEILRAQRTHGDVSLLMIDLDDFKLVNDTLGHVFGDAVLRWVAEQIRVVLRASDVPARYGGDEFAVILPDTDAAGALEVGQRIVAALADRPLRAGGRGPVAVGASIGVATFPADGRSASALVMGADAALYRVKESGGRGVDGRVRRRLAGRGSPRAGATGDQVDAATDRRRGRVV